MRAARRDGSPRRALDPSPSTPHARRRRARDGGPRRASPTPGVTTERSSSSAAGRRRDDGDGAEPAARPRTRRRRSSVELRRRRLRDAPRVAEGWWAARAPGRARARARPRILPLASGGSRRQPLGVRAVRARRRSRRWSPARRGGSRRGRRGGGRQFAMQGARRDGVGGGSRAPARVRGPSLDAATRAGCPTPPRNVRLPGVLAAPRCSPRKPTGASATSAARRRFRARRAARLDAETSSAGLGRDEGFGVSTPADPPDADRRRTSRPSARPTSPRSATGCAAPRGDRPPRALARSSPPRRGATAVNVRAITPRTAGDPGSAQPARRGRFSRRRPRPAGRNR